MKSEEKKTEKYSYEYLEEENNCGVVQEWWGENPAKATNFIFAPFHFEFVLMIHLKRC
jgi:hypothetical protein